MTTTTTWGRLRCVTTRNEQCCHLDSESRPRDRIGYELLIVHLLSLEAEVDFDMMMDGNTRPVSLLVLMQGGFGRR